MHRKKSQEQVGDKGALLIMGLRPSASPGRGGHGGPVCGFLTTIIVTSRRRKKSEIMITSILSDSNS